MESIKDGIGRNSLANEVRLLRASHNGSFLLVEGAGDKKFLSKFLKISSCEIVVCLGRERLIGAVSELEREGFIGALGFADRDFSEIIGYPIYEGEVVFTDENDLEIMLLCSPALDRVLVEYGKPDVARNIASEGANVRNMIFDSARVVGALRVLSQERSWSLNFDEMKYYFVSRSCLLDVRKTIRHVISRSVRSSGLSSEAVESLVVERISNSGSARELCCGHDCVRVLGRALKNQIGNTSDFDGPKGSKRLERLLRVAYDENQFKSTNAYDHVKKWEKLSGYDVLQ